MEENKLTALEELEDDGIEMMIFPATEESPEELIKISLLIQFYNDGSWVIDSLAPEDGSCHSTLGSGDDLESILPYLKRSRDLFLKALKEMKEGESK